MLARVEPKNHEWRKLITMRRRDLFCLFAAPLTLLGKSKEWKEGHVTAIDIKDFMTGRHNNKIQHRYLCIIGDADFNYFVEFEKPLKAAVNEKIRFAVEKDKFLLVDADGKQREAKIEKRERVQL